MPDGSPLQPELFIFTSEELALSPRLGEVLTPPHVKAAAAAAILQASMNAHAAASNSNGAAPASAAAPAAAAPAVATEATVSTTEGAATSTEPAAAAV